MKLDVCEKTNKFIEENLGLVRLCAKRFVCRNLEYDDIFQAGCLGLVKAARKFDKTRGVKFSSYAVPTILGEIKQLFSNNSQLKTSRSLKELALRIKKENDEYFKNNNKQLTISELSQILQVDTHKIIEAIEYSNISLDSELGASSGAGYWTSSEPYVEFDENGISEKICIKNAIGKLDKNDRIIVYLRFFLYKTQSHVAKVLKTNQVKISRREKFILNFLKHKLY
ncbi:MAG: sigma-70 family RNA polymerase sigma factor [Candidatus Improbicoccus devescovinae]|nr:MAG: sigma-70 family RNA polymerase sigma factor [Candidatus Improbicoccus devescovinae]